MEIELEMRGQNGDSIDGGKRSGHIQDTWFQEWGLERQIWEKLCWERHHGEGKGKETCTSVR